MQVNSTLAKHMRAILSANGYRNAFHRDRKMNMSDLFFLVFLRFELNISKEYFTRTVVFFPLFVRFFDYFSCVTKPNGSPFALLLKFITPLVYVPKHVFSSDGAG